MGNPEPFSGSGLNLFVICNLDFLTTMPKESFKQPIKREEPPIEEMEKKLDKAEKMVEEVEEDLKIEEFIEKPVKELKRLWEENEEEMRKQRRKYETFSFSYSLPLPETPPSFLERVSNKFLKEFDWGKFRERAFLGDRLGLFLSAFLSKNIENYVSSQKEKGIKEENIKPIEVHLNVEELPIRLDFLGYRNPKRLHLFIKGDVGLYVGCSMTGGKIEIKGNAGHYVGWKMCGGEIKIEEDAGAFVGEEMNGGEIKIEGNIEGSNTGARMRSGKIIVKGNARNYVGWEMYGGEIKIDREVKYFDRSAFVPPNKGTIIWKGIKIWEKGNWTKEGKEMWKRGEIPVEG